jgi:hypothetical protein
MSTRGLVVVLFLLAALGLGWQQRQRLQAWAEAVPLQVSTGSGPLADATSSKTSSKFKPGDLRKCVKGQQVSYSNVECPAGHQEQAVTAAPVNVLPATPVPKPAATGSGPSALHKALDITRDDSLKDKLIERAVEGPAR